MSIPSTIAQALDRGIIHRPIDLRGDEVDLLILAAPVSAILDWLDRVPAVFSGEFHLLDLGSTKTQIVERMQSLPDRISPLGGHPMCGKETSGLSVADGDLYRGLSVRAHAAGSNAARHVEHRARTDRRAARPIAAARSATARSRRGGDQPSAVSHRLTLVDAVLQLDDDAAWTLAASGFRDTSRLAASDVTMLLDILKSNRAEVLQALDSAQSSLQETIELIEREDWPESAREVGSGAREADVVGEHKTSNA